MSLTIVWMRHGNRVKPLGDTPITKESFRQLMELGKNLAKKVEIVRLFCGPTQRQRESQQALREGILEVNPGADIKIKEDVRLVDVRMEPNYRKTIEFDKEGNKVPGWRIMKAYLGEKNLKKLGCETVEELIARHQQAYNGIVKEYGSAKKKVLSVIVGTEPASTIFFRQVLKELHIPKNPLKEEILPRGGYFQIAVKSNALSSISLPALQWRYP